MTESSQYNALIKYHALKWLETDHSLDPLIYLEKHGGCVMSAFLIKYGVSTVIEHLVEERRELVN